MQDIAADQLSYLLARIDALAPVLPAGRADASVSALSDAARLFALKPGEGVVLRGGAGMDCLHVLSGLATVSHGDAEPFRLGPSKGRGCPFSMPRDARPVTVMAAEKTLLCHVDRDKLDFLILWEELGRGLAGDDELAGRMRKIRNSLVFRRVPAEAVAEAVRRMESVTVSAGDEVVRQGDPGDYFYVIDEGCAEVWREEFPGDDPERVCELGEGDDFGEEALVTGKERSATVRMTTVGRLLRLGKDDFTALVSHSLIREVPPKVARALLESGHTLLDVRYEDEVYEAYIPGSVSIPLHELRSRTAELSPAGGYVVYCRSGKRSAVAALLLSERGLDAVSLRGGILDWPYEIGSHLPTGGPRS